MFLVSNIFLLLFGQTAIFIYCSVKWHSVKCTFGKKAIFMYCSVKRTFGQMSFGKMYFWSNGFGQMAFGQTYACLLKSSLTFKVYVPDKKALKVTTMTEKGPQNYMLIAASIAERAE